MYRRLIAQFIRGILLINLHNDSDDSDICKRRSAVIDGNLIMTPLSY